MKKNTPSESYLRLDSHQPCTGGDAEYIRLAYYRDSHGNAKVKKFIGPEPPRSAEAGLHEANQAMVASGMEVVASSFFVVRKCEMHGKKTLLEAAGALIIARANYQQYNMRIEPELIDEQGVGRLAIGGEDMPLVVLPSANTDTMAHLQVMEDIGPLLIARHASDPIAIFEPDYT